MGSENPQVIKKLIIRGFRSIRNLDPFPLRALNVLIGANGAGKSNLVDFFRMISAMMREGGLREFAALHGGADEFLFGGPKETAEIFVGLQFGPNAYAFQLVPTNDGVFTINNERTFFRYENEKYEYVIGHANSDPQLLKDKDNPSPWGKKHGVAWYVWEAIRSWKVYHFHDTGRTAGMRRAQDPGNCESLLPDAANLAPYLRKLKLDYPSAYEEIQQAVRLVIPFFDDFVLEPDPGSEKVRLRWRQKGLQNDYVLSPSQLSDGSIRFICLATVLCQPNPPATMVLDEPELGLHPEALEILAEMMRRFTMRFRRGQLIVSTQSPILVDQFDVEDLIVVRRVDGATTLERLSEADFSEWLRDYTLGQLWCKNVITGGPTHE